jgi:hypothetical protein
MFPMAEIKPLMHWMEFPRACRCAASATASRAASSDGAQSVHTAANGSPRLIAEQELYRH